MPWLLIDTNSIIDNVIEYDGVAEFTPPEGLTLVHYTGSVQVSPGFPWNGTDPVPPLAAAVLALAATSAVKLEGNTGSAAFTFTVSRTGSLTQTSTVIWAVTGSGTNQATAADFAGNVLPSGIVTFASGETSKTITIDIAADTTAEFDERFAVTLSGPSAGTTIGTASASGLIQNDDAAASGVFNGHRYDVMVNGEGVAWTDARDRAVSMGGYLACITSAEEDAFVFGLAKSITGTFVVGSGPFLGGYQASNGSAPNASWSWVTGEPFTYAAWLPGNPSNDSGLEDYLHYKDNLNPNWNDVLAYQWHVQSYIVETPLPAPNLSIAATSATKLEGHTGTTPFTLTVTRTGDTSSTVTVDWTTMGAGLNLATADDFQNSVFPSGTLSFGIPPVTAA